MSKNMGRRDLLKNLATTVAALSMTGGCALAEAVPKRAFGPHSRLPLGIQLYMLGDAPFRDPGATFAEIAEIGYQEAELPQLPAKNAASFGAAAAAAGVRLSSLHLGSGRLAPKGNISLDSEPAAIADAMGALGIRQAVLSLMPAPERTRFGGGRAFGDVLLEAIAAEGADYWMRLAALLNDRAAALAPHGISLGYHNHNIEFAPLGRGSGFDLLVQQLDPGLVHFELDIGWVAAAGRDPAAMLDALHGRVRQLHLKDIAAGSPTNFALEIRPAVVGAGTIDWCATLAAARRAGVRHAYVEQEPPFALPRMEAARQSFAYLAELKI